jgi:hypothetical protein
MKEHTYSPWKKLQEKWISRRNLIRGAAGTAAGAGFLLGSGLRARALADNEDEGEQNACKPSPRPIPHISTPPGGHFFFPGPVDGAPSTDPHFPNAGFDPSIITDFSGVIGQADLILSGIGTDLNTGASAEYDFHTDMRFMDGVFVGLDKEEHRGAIGFI